MRNLVVTFVTLRGWQEFGCRRMHWSDMRFYLQFDLKISLSKSTVLGLYFGALFIAPISQSRVSSEESGSQFWNASFLFEPGVSY